MILLFKRRVVLLVIPGILLTFLSPIHTFNYNIGLSRLYYYVIVVNYSIFTSIIVGDPSSDITTNSSLDTILKFPIIIFHPAGPAILIRPSKHIAVPLKKIELVLISNDVAVM